MKCSIIIHRKLGKTKPVQDNDNISSKFTLFLLYFKIHNYHEVLMIILILLMYESTYRLLRKSPQSFDFIDTWGWRYLDSFFPSANSIFYCVKWPARIFHYCFEFCYMTSSESQTIKTSLKLWRLSNNKSKTPFIRLWIHH